jgi:hypothetical protein
MIRSQWRRGFLEHGRLQSPDPAGESQGSIPAPQRVWGGSTVVRCEHALDMSPRAQCSFYR